MSRTTRRAASLLTAFALCFSLLGYISSGESHAAVKKIHVLKATVSLNAGETYKQKLINKKGKTIKATKVKWKSGKTSIATITKAGKIKAVKAGTAKMTAKYSGKTYKFTVKVNALKLRSTSIKTGVSQTYQQKLLQTSGKAISASKITWHSASTSVAEITSSGKIFALKAGTAKMTAKYCGKTYSFTVNVPKISIVPTSLTIKEKVKANVQIMVDDSVDGNIMKRLDYDEDKGGYAYTAWTGEWMKYNDSTWYKYIEVEGYREGPCTLTVYAEDDPGTKFECKINVTPQINDVIGIKAVTLRVGQTVTMTVHCNKDGTMYPSCNWDIIDFEWGTGRKEDDFSYYYEFTITGKAAGETYLKIYDGHNENVYSTVAVYVTE